MKLLVKGCCGWYQHGGLQENKGTAKILHPAQENPRVRMAGALLGGQVTFLFLKHPLIASARRSDVGPGGIEPPQPFLGIISAPWNAEDPTPVTAHLSNCNSEKATSTVEREYNPRIIVFLLALEQTCPNPTCRESPVPTCPTISQFPTAVCGQGLWAAGQHWTSSSQTAMRRQYSNAAFLLEKDTFAR